MEGGGEEEGERGEGGGEEEEDNFHTCMASHILPSNHRVICGYSSDHHTTHFRPDNDGGKRFFD